MQRTRFSIFCFLIFGVAIFGTSLHAQISTNATVALSSELNKLKMYDLSKYLLTREMKNNPQGRDKFKVQMAETHFSMNKEEEGMKLLKAISSASPAYLYSRIVLGKQLWKKGEHKNAAAEFEKYFTKIKPTPPKPNEPFRIKAFQEAVLYLQDCYKKLGMTDEAVEVMKRLSWIAPVGEDDPLAKFKDIVFSSLIKLDIAEQMKAEGKPAWEKDAESVLEPLDSILYAECDPTLMTILAANEKLRACVLLGKFNDAKGLIASYKDMTRFLDKHYKQQKAFYEAPSAKMYLWIAEYHYALAEKEEDKVKRIALNTKAINDFYRIITTYDIKLCPYIPNAARGFNKAKIALFKDGKTKIKTDVVIPLNFEAERVQALYGKKLYAKVIPVILKLIRSPGGMNNESTSDLLSKLIDCYIKTDKLLEAITVAGFLGDCFPDSPHAPNFLLMLGKMKWEESKAKKGTPEGLQAKKDALIAYEWYTINFPTHEYASDICTKIAMEYFNFAQIKASEINKMPNGPEKLKANLEARQGFLTVIPKFQRIVDNYSHTKRGKEAAFIIGNCYSNALKYLEGSETFAKYYELETNNPKVNERLMSRVADAKFRMADNYVKYAESINKEIEPLFKQRDLAPETVDEGSKVKTKADIQKLIDEKKENANKYFNIAITNFKELTGSWMRKGGRLYGLTKADDKKKVKDLYDKTIAYIPWVYNYIGDIDKTIAAFTEFLVKFPKHKSVPNALKQRAFKYIEKGETALAAKDFGELSSKYPEKAKEIQPELAKAMYKTKKYNKSIEAVAKMFEGDPAAISISNLRWIATNLTDCGGTHPKEGSELALKAAKLLLKYLKTPVISDWMHKNRVAELEADATKREATFAIIKDQILLLGTTAAFWSEEYKTSLAYLNQILSNPNSSYFYVAHFKRARVYSKLEEYSKALKDYGEISNTLIGDLNAPDSLKYKTQVLAGIVFIRQSELGKAIASMGGAVMSVAVQDAELAAFNTKEITKEEEELQAGYVEAALFLSAVCQNALGDKDRVNSIVDTYRKNYPAGQYKSQMAVLPAPEKAIEMININID